MAKWNKIGSLRKSEKGSLYLKIDSDASLKKGQSLQLMDPRKSIDRAVENGKMTSDQAEERKAKIPEYVRYEAFLVTEE